MTNTWGRVLGICTTFVGVMALAADARAQAGCMGTAGPDVIVGDVTGPANYTAVGTLEAVALGTTSCNLGTVWLNWISGTNQHPAIGGGVFKLKTISGAPRFEQLGQSWLKHGFFALSENLCCVSCSATDGTHLGVGCSDPYTASRNGSQSGLGPKWNVNAHTGVFTYPVTHPAGGNNGRIQIDVANLETNSASVNYWGEMMYITPDDAAAGNQNNNCSDRKMTVSGSGSAWTFGFTGSTTRQAPAVVAWKTFDPSVNQTILAVPEASGTGRMYMNWQVTNLGGGQWHYEYMLYNQNSDNSGQSFSVPIGAGVTVSNIGFHDVDYLGGDGIGAVNFSPTDWTVTQNAGSITWATDTFAVNSNANALRWGTGYNFRFDADTAPVSGTATIGLFKLANSTMTTVDVPGSNLGTPGTSLCAGDNTDPFMTFCPCSPGAIGHGCANSVDPAGALLNAIGFTNPDTVSLQCAQMPTVVSAIFLKGDFNNSTGILFGDGVRCVDGALIRLGTENNVNGASSYPTGVQSSVSVRGATPPGSGLIGYYQTYYRNSAAAFCPPETFNVSNGYQITW